MAQNSRRSLPLGPRKWLWGRCVWARIQKPARRRARLCHGIGTTSGIRIAVELSQMDSCSENAIERKERDYASREGRQDLDVRYARHERVPFDQLSS
jgi:hypothetical protein